MLMLKRTVDLTPRVASIPTPSMTYVPLGQFGQGERKLSGGEQHRALASSDRQTAEKSDGDRPAAAHASPQCGGDELWLWRFLLAGRPFGATGASAGGPDDGATWLSGAEHALARRLPRPPDAPSLLVGAHRTTLDFRPLVPLPSCAGACPGTYARSVVARVRRTAR